METERSERGRRTTGMVSGCGRAVAAVAAAAAVTLAVMASGADADCFDYCYKNCVANDRSMADYCNYACDKTCEPGSLQQRPLAAAAAGGLTVRCQIDCVRRSCTGFHKDRKGMVACYRGCFHGCKTGTVPRPLHAGSDTGSGSVLMAKGGDVFRPKSEPVRPGTGMDAGSSSISMAKRDDVFHPKSEPVRSGMGAGSSPVSMEKMGDAFHPKSEPVRSGMDTDSSPVMMVKRGEAVRPNRPAPVFDHPFHEKQDAVQPAAVPDHPIHQKQDAVQPAAVPDDHP